MLETVGNSGHRQILSDCPVPGGMVRICLSLKDPPSTVKPQIPPPCGWTVSAGPDNTEKDTGPSWASDSSSSWCHRKSCFSPWLTWFWHPLPLLQPILADTIRSKSHVPSRGQGKASSDVSALKAHAFCSATKQDKDRDLHLRRPAPTKIAGSGPSVDPQASRGPRAAAPPPLQSLPARPRTGSDALRARVFLPAYSRPAFRLPFRGGN
ncbi:PREDICTED: uncharacterized protein LOC105575220 [Cercocebus atys]|uniref:uncharacterized protein LOC105575220 n=1 Tax=Cercocebus atys TaxID=9531 RepID=UPI0005F56821|nr:PREDICTED: uncharacterized protein LOC105575220 [Cercocebus atys]XP_011892290.1 PREDICTED: uncharacterized protein LOC105575220 [Cercocebus atys]